MFIYVHIYVFGLVIDIGRSAEYIVSNGWALNSNYVHQIPEFIISVQTERKMGRGTIWATYININTHTYTHTHTHTHAYIHTYILANFSTTDHNSRSDRHSAGRTWTRCACVCVVCMFVCVVCVYVCVCVCNVCVCVSVCVMCVCVWTKLVRRKRASQKLH